MNISDEIERLQRLRASGALTEDEFRRAKQRLLDGDGGLASLPGDGVGRAANRYVTFMMVMGGIGVVIFIILFFTIFLPGFRAVGHDFGRPDPGFPSLNGPGPVIPSPGRP